MADKFFINEFGEIVRSDFVDTPKTTEEELGEELARLSYEINHLTRPTKDPEKIARYHELQKILGVDEKMQDKALAAGRAKILERFAKNRQTNVWPGKNKEI